MKTNRISASRWASIILTIPLLLLFAFGSYSQQIGKSVVGKNGVFIGFYEYKPVNYKSLPNKKYPLIIFLSGIGERGNGISELSRLLGQGIPRLINAGATMTFGGETFLVLSPQLSSTRGYWEPFYVDEMLDYAYKNLQVDINRIYLTGLSLGGGGVWTYANASVENSKKFAAIVPVCGTCYYNYGTLKSTIGASFVGVWGFTNADDNVVSPQCTIQAVDAIGVSAIVKKTVYPTGGHNSWDKAYDIGHNIQSPNVYEWMLTFSRAMTILPVKLNQFNVTKTTGGIDIKWKSEFEQKLGYYEVEKSLDGKTFSMVTKVTASGAAHAYSVVDFNTFPGTVYYRLKMVALDGTADYSVVKQIINEAGSVYTVNIYDNMGRLLLKQKLANINEVLSGLKSKGLYFVNINDGKNSATKTFRIL